jgi:hypothetical protein
LRLDGDALADTPDVNVGTNGNHGSGCLVPEDERLLDD